MKFGAIIAARTSSRRLPGKALLPLMGVPMIVFLIRRIKQSSLLHDIVFATTDLPEDDRLAEIVAKEGVGVYRGSENDVLNRVVQAAATGSFDYAVRLTGDCPFLDAATLDFVLKKAMEIKNFDLLTTKPNFPKGIDYEICGVELLAKINQRSNLTTAQREHALNFIYDNEPLFKIVRLVSPPELIGCPFVFTVDTKEDYDNALSLLEGSRDGNNTVTELIKLCRQRKQ